MSTRFGRRPARGGAACRRPGGPALAHEGHDHGAAQPPVSKTIAPRGEALSDAFELVAIPRDGTLTLFLDRFRTNEPVPGATIEVETPDGPRVATATTDGGYALPAPWLSKPGRHDLVATVTAGDAVDVLTVAVTVPDPKVARGRGACHAAPAQAALARVSEVAHDVRERLTAKDPALVAAVGRRLPARRARDGARTRAPWRAGGGAGRHRHHPRARHRRLRARRRGPRLNPFRARP